MLNNLKLKISILVTTLIILIILVFFIFLVPRFKNSNMQIQAKNILAIANSLSAANSINYLKRKKHPTEGRPVNNCQDVGFTLTEQLPTGYHIQGLAVSADKTEICTLNGPGNSTGTFYATGIL